MTLRYSNTAFLEILPSLPIEGIGWEAGIYSYADFSTLLAVVPRFEDLTISNVISEEGSGTLSIDARDDIFLTNMPNGQPGTPGLYDHEHLVRVFHNGIVRKEWLIEDVQLDVIKDDEKKVNIFAGRGTAKVLEWAIVLPAGFPNHVSLSRTDPKGPVMDQWVALFHEAQARGKLTFVSLTFDGVTDSAGVPWIDDSLVTTDAGTNLLELLIRFAGAVGFEWRMLPGFRLEARQTFGNERSETVTFWEAGQVTEQGDTRTRRDIATDLYVNGSGLLVQKVTDAAAAAKWRHRERWVSASDAADASTLAMYANATLKILKEEDRSVATQVTPDAPGREIFVNYDVGDWIGVQTQAPQTGSYRVMAATVKVTDPLNVDLELTLQSKKQSAIVRIQQALNRLGYRRQPASTSTTSTSTASTAAEKAIANTSLDALKDVDAPTPSEGQILKHVGDFWIAAGLNLAELEDVDLSTPPEDLQFLQFDETTGMWKAGDTTFAETADLAAETAARIAGDNALDSRVDVLEAATSHSLLPFSYTGDIAVVSGTHRLYVERSLTITSVRAAIGTPSAGAAVIVDVRKNGASLFASPGDRPTIPAGQNTDTANAIASPALVAGDYLTVDILQIGSSTPGSNLTVTVEVAEE